jgi:5S rRNA maturation endonuclease (ribonuclease M5)
MAQTFSRDQILAAHPLRDECERRGLEFKKQGGEWYAKCPFHQDGSRPNFRMNEEKGTWFCDPCGKGGSVVDFVAQFDSKPATDVFKEWAMSLGGSSPENAPARRTGTPQGNPVATYDYRNEAGDLAYQVCRFEPKTFRQRRMVDGKWSWSMDGATRILYRLPDVLNSETVWVVEGEKDADTLHGLGIVGTCNVGGAGKWLDGYTHTLKSKDVVLCGDNDEPGRQHIDKVLVSIREVVRSVKIVRVPDPHKDVSDWVKSSKEEMRPVLLAAAGAAPIVGGLYLLPVKSMSELEAEYVAYAQQSEDVGLDLSKWLPSFRGKVRPLVPGELMVILADTGVGKTALLQNLAYNAGITTLLFELELPGTLTFERFVALATSLPCSTIEEGYKAGEKGQVSFKKLDHIWVCSKSGLTIKEMRRLIEASELKIGRKPALVMVDYIQLVQGEGKNRYERTSSVAEDLKVMAKDTGTIVVCASQVGRKDYSDGSEVHLHDGKNAGEIENSSGLVIGAWREPEDPSTLHIKTLKNTKGRSGVQIECNFDGERMRITERAKIAPGDIPGNYP